MTIIEEPSSWISSIEHLPQFFQSANPPYLFCNFLFLKPFPMYQHMLIDSSHSIPRYDVFPCFPSPFRIAQGHDAFVFPLQERTQHGVNRPYPATFDRCIAGSRTRRLGFDGHCHVSLSLHYPAEQKLQAFPFTVLYSLFMAFTACLLVEYSRGLPTALLPS